MRATTFVLTLALATAAFAALPVADAAPICVEGTCVSKELIDPCRFQSDCCSTTMGFWCPEHS